jgi:hypothetical protein
MNIFSCDGCAKLTQEIKSLNYELDGFYSFPKPDWRIAFDKQSQALQIAVEALEFIGQPIPFEFEADANIDRAREALSNIKALT